MRTYTALGCKQIRHRAHSLITCKILDIDAIQEIEYLTQLYLKVLPEYTKRTFKIGGSGVVVNAFGLYPKNGEFKSLLPHHGDDRSIHSVRVRISPYLLSNLFGGQDKTANLYRCSLTGKTTVSKTVNCRFESYHLCQ